MPESVQLVEDRLADVDAGGARTLVDFVFRRAAPRVFLRRKLDYPMFEAVGEVAVAEQELIRFAVPADQGLRLCAADRGAYPQNRSKRLGTVQIGEFPVRRLARRLHELAHLECGGAPAWSMVRLVGKGAGRAASDVREAVERSDLRPHISFLLKPAVYEPAPERVRQRARERRRQPRIFASRQIRKDVRLLAKRHHERRKLYPRAEELAVVLKRISLAYCSCRDNCTDSLSPQRNHDALHVPELRHGAPPCWNGQPVGVSSLCPVFRKAKHPLLAERATSASRFS